MPSLMFIVPVHGRIPLAQICLRQLRRTCDSLIDSGVGASAILISDRETLDMLEPTALGFGWAERDNQFTSRKFNDGIQLATDPGHNPSPADYVVPCGSDDWVSPCLFDPLPPPDTMYGFQRMSFVNETGTQIAFTHLNYQGGSGVRIIPRQLLQKLDYRPADEDRPSGCDTSILRNLYAFHHQNVNVQHRLADPRWIVDWKTTGEQLNSFTTVTYMRTSRMVDDPFAELEPFYPAESLAEMKAHYGLVACA